MKIAKWNYTLTHDTYIDDYGILCDRLKITQALPNWDYIDRFLVPPMKVKNYWKDTDVFHGTNWYTKRI